MGGRRKGGEHETTTGAGNNADAVANVTDGRVLLGLEATKVRHQLDVQFHTQLVLTVMARTTWLCMSVYTRIQDGHSSQVQSTTRTKGGRSTIVAVRASACGLYITLTSSRPQFKLDTCDMPSLPSPSPNAFPLLAYISQLVPILQRSIWRKCLYSEDATSMTSTRIMCPMFQPRLILGMQPARIPAPKSLPRRPPTVETMA